MTVELAWRRRKRERLERAAAERRHREALRAAIFAALINTPRVPRINGDPVFEAPERLLFVDEVLKEVRRP